jgi:uncharacterized protein (TIGR02611 family)
LRVSGVDGSGVTPDSGPLGPPPGDTTRTIDQPAPSGWRRRASFRMARIRARILRFRRRMYATRLGRVGVKLMVAVVGTLIVALGVVLLPLPGPGWVIIFAGLAVLAMEFPWARRLLAFAREQVRRWTRAVREGSWLVRVVSAVGLLLVISCALALSLRMLT